MDAIWRAQGRQLDGVRSSIEQMVLNGSIYTADSRTISQYEKFLGITTDLSTPLEERRKVVAAMMYSTQHIGAPEIKEIVGLFTPADADVTFEDGVIGLSVQSSPDEPLDVEACFKALQRQIPAHLAWIFDTIYATKTPGVASTGVYTEMSGRIDIWPFVAREMETTGSAAYTSGTEMSGKLGIWPLVIREMDTTGGVKHTAGTEMGGKVDIWPMAVREMDTSGAAERASTQTYHPMLEIYPQGGQMNG